MRICKLGHKRRRRIHLSTVCHVVGLSDGPWNVFWFERVVVVILEVWIEAAREKKVQKEVVRKRNKLQEKNVNGECGQDLFVRWEPLLAPPKAPLGRPL